MAWEDLRAEVESLFAPGEVLQAIAEAAWQTAMRLRQRRYRERCFSRPTRETRRKWRANAWRKSRGHRTSYYRRKRESDRRLLLAARAKQPPINWPPPRPVKPPHGRKVRA